ncbi:MAG: ParB/RepB/Spo0J family partition protein [Verrucomicrobia bacterium]|nr:ParB/RepB/Spo0J family partition protein [Verrucomicrobiota bacterium]
MAAKHIGLGRGLSALIKDTAPAEAPPAAEGGSGVVRLPVDQIHKSPWQPRHGMRPEAIEELAHSIREHGVLQPLLVRRVENHYELIAGERRLRGAQAAELREVPALIMDVSDREALELALIENLQREDLNLIEEAEGYRTLVEKFEMTQEQIAQRVGKARATVANSLRLLDLPDGVKQKVAEGALSGGHAKVLLGLEIPREQELLAARVLKEGLSVRALEKVVERLRKMPRKPRAERSDLPESYLQSLTDRLHQHLGTAVHLLPCRTLANGRKAKGSLVIEFYTNEELDRLLAILGLAENL